MTARPNMRWCGHARDDGAPRAHGPGDVLAGAIEQIAADQDVVGAVAEVDPHGAAGGGIGSHGHLVWFLGPAAVIAASTSSTMVSFFTSRDITVRSASE